MEDILQLLQFEQDFATIRTEFDQERILSKYPNFNHPHYFYKIAESNYLRFDNYQKARPYIKKTIEFGFKAKNSYNETPFADSIGQCMLMYLNNETTLNLTEQFKISCLCYVYFSQLINKHGSDAYNSYFSRGLLIQNNKNEPGTKKMIADYYYNGPDLCIEMLTNGDFVQAIIGFKEANEISNAQRALGYATKGLTLMKSLPQYSNMVHMSDMQIAHMSLENSKYFANKLLQDFKMGIFDI